MAPSTRSSNAAVDADGDSTMRSSPSASPVEDNDIDEGLEMLPGDNPTNVATSPSSGGPSSPSTARATHGLNANGKRVLSTAVDTDTAGLSAAAVAAADAQNTADGGGQQRLHEPSGYTWVRDEDGPGYAWRNKRAQEEYARAMDGIVARDVTVGSLYGDPVTVTLIPEEA